MRIVYRNLRTGEVKVVPETEDDLWILQMVISPGDIVVARTTRDVRFGEGRSSRVPMTLAIRVKSVEFEPFTTRLRIHGIVIEGPERFGVKGSHHTLRIDLGSELTIIKEQWSKPLFDKLLNAETRGLKAIVVALDYDEYSIAIVQEQGVKYINEGEIGLPGKDDPQRDKILEAKLNEIADKIVDTAKRNQVDAIIVASPGDLKRRVAELIKSKDEKLHIYVDSISIGGRSGILEVLRRDIVREVLRDVSSIEAEKVLEEFMKLLIKDSERVAYGLEGVIEAANMGAIEKLLILDELVRSYNVDERRRVEELLTIVDKYRGEVRIVSSESPAGERLRALGGIIAILRFRIK